MLSAANLLAPAGELLKLGLYGIDHNRTNHLHRTDIALLFRLHEAELLAAQEYHRQAVEQSNRQHARENLQERYQHEEDVDNEKRVATRANFRDDWIQLSTQSEFVLIVNTILLSVAFAMLIEGHLPDSATLVAPVLTVAYFCSIASSICLLISSVRFAVVFRFSVGRTIVSEMREALSRTQTLDEEYRLHRVYTRTNQPELVQAACSPGWTDYLLTRSLARQMRQSFTGHQSAEDARSGKRNGAFSCGKRANEKKSRLNNYLPDHYEDLRWLTDATGGLGCPKRNMHHINTSEMHGQLRSSESERIKKNAPLGAGVGAEVSMCDVKLSVSSDDAEFLTPRSLDEPPSPPSPPSPQSPPEPAPEPAPAQESVQKQSPRREGVADSAVLDPYEQEYRKLLYKRWKNIQDDHEELKALQVKQCTPWQEASKLLVQAGSFMLLVAACLLVCGRYYVQPIPLHPGEVSYPDSPWAAWGFSVPCIITMFFLLCLEVILHKVREHHRIEKKKRKRERKASLEALRVSEGRRTHFFGIDDPETGDAEERMFVQLTTDTTADSSQPSIVRQGSSSSLTSASSHTSSSSQTLSVLGIPIGISMLLSPKADQVALRFSYTLMCVLIVVSLPAFTVMAAVDAPSFSWRPLGTSSQVASSSTKAELLPEAPLTPQSLKLAPGFQWPAFWEPRAAAWSQQEGSLLLAGDSSFTMAHLNRMNDDSLEVSRSTPLRHFSASTFFNLCDICFASSSMNATENWLAAMNSKNAVRLVRVSGSMGSFAPVNEWRNLETGAEGAGAGQSPLACRLIGDSSARLELWTSVYNDESSPVLLGWHLDLARGTFDSGNLLEPNISMEFPLSWILANDATAAIFRSSGTGSLRLRVQSVDVSSSGRLFILLTVQVASKSPWQSLVAIDSAGKLSRIWTVIGPKRGMQLWGSLAIIPPQTEVGASSSHGRLVLVAGGHSPELAEVMLPSSYF